MAPTAVEDMFSVSGCARAPATELAMVISSPSSTHATPSAMTSRVWNGDHGSRSTLAGIRLRTTPGAASVVVSMSGPPSQQFGDAEAGKPLLVQFPALRLKRSAPYAMPAGVRPAPQGQLQAFGPYRANGAQGQRV